MAFCLGSEYTMRYSKYAVLSLMWITGPVAVLILSACGGGDNSGDGKTVIDIKDSVVLPPSAVKSAPPAPKPLGALLQTRFVVLPEMDQEKALASKDTAGTAQQIGAARAVAATSTVAQTQSALQWTDLPSGEKAAAINIESTGAYGLRVGVLVERLPDGARLRIYSQEKTQAIMEHSGVEINALLAQNRKAGESGAAANTWWTPDVGAGDATLEVVLPVGMDADALRISVPMVSHIYQNLALPTDDESAEIEQRDSIKVSASQHCRLDAACNNNYRARRDAVARMAFTRSNGASYLCTGTLLNSAKGDFVPYFLTANHCISSQVVASTLQTRWFYRSSSCNSGMPVSNSAMRGAGATLLYASAVTDSTLLRLNEMPPVGVNYAGWDARNLAPKGHSVYGLHHPAGDLLKYSVGVVADHVSCESTGGKTFSCSEDVNGGYYRITWSEGRTEGGSSGSALFGNGRVIGTLYGGRSRCQEPRGHSYYGRFDRFFKDGASRWLGR